MFRASCAALQGVHEMPPYSASLPPPPQRWAPRVVVGEAGAAEDDAALWEAAAPQSAAEMAAALAGCTALLTPAAPRSTLQ